VFRFAAQGIRQRILRRSFSGSLSTKLTLLLRCALLAGLTLVTSAIQAEIIGAEQFNYSHGAVAGKSGGTLWDYKNFAPVGHVGTASTWDNFAGTPAVANGKLVTDNSSAKREYHGANEADGAVNDPASVLSEVRGAFWLAGKPSRTSADGRTWRDLPAAVPLGQVIASDQGTLISIHQQRENILRSGDGGKTRQEVHSYQPEKIEGGAPGLRDGAFGLAAP
jgi:hypothetical protein